MPHTLMILDEKYTPGKIVCVNSTCLVEKQTPNFMGEIYLNIEGKDCSHNIRIKHGAQLFFSSNEPPIFYSGETWRNNEQNTSIVPLTDSILELTKEYNSEFINLGIIQQFYLNSVYLSYLPIE